MDIGTCKTTNDLESEIADGRQTIYLGSQV